MAVVVVVLLALVWAACLWMLTVWPIRDVARRRESTVREAGRSRDGTIALILVNGWVGGLYYRTRMRPVLDEIEEQAEHRAAESAA